MRVLQPVHYLRGEREVMPFDAVPQTGLETLQNGKRDNLYQDNVKPPRMLNDSFHRPHTERVLGCKAEHNSYKVIRREPVSSVHGVYAPTGYARHQPKGLATLKGKPTSGEIMPLSSSFYAGNNNKLGQPRG